MTAQPNKQRLAIKAIGSDCLTERQMLFIELPSAAKHYELNFSLFNVSPLLYICYKNLSITVCNLSRMDSTVKYALWEVLFQTFTIRPILQQPFACPPSHNSPDFHCVEIGDVPHICAFGKNRHALIRDRSG
jgi:hypothetical protein